MVIRNGQQWTSLPPCSSNTGAIGMILNSPWTKKKKKKTPAFSIFFNVTRFYFILFYMVYIFFLLVAAELRL